MMPQPAPVRIKGMQQRTSNDLCSLVCSLSPSLTPIAETRVINRSRYVLFIASYFTVCVSCR